jgi:hypothetical protein
MDSFRGRFLDAFDEPLSPTPGQGPGGAEPGRHRAVTASRVQ